MSMYALGHCRSQRTTFGAHLHELRSSQSTSLYVVERLACSDVSPLLDSVMVAKDCQPHRNHLGYTVISVQKSLDWVNWCRKHIPNTLADIHPPASWQCSSMPSCPTFLLPRLHCHDGQSPQTESPNKPFLSSVALVKCFVTTTGRATDTDGFLLCWEEETALRMRLSGFHPSSVCSGPTIRSRNPETQLMEARVTWSYV